MKTKTRFAFRVDIGDDVGGSIVEHVGGAARITLLASSCGKVLGWCATPGNG